MAVIEPAPFKITCATETAIDSAAALEDVEEALRLISNLVQEERDLLIQEIVAPRQRTGVLRPAKPSKAGGWVETSPIIRNGFKPIKG